MAQKHDVFVNDFSGNNSFYQVTEQAPFGII